MINDSSHLTGFLGGLNGTLEVKLLAQSLPRYINGCYFKERKQNKTMERAEVPEKE
jgi:hypothetical protein